MKTMVDPPSGWLYGFPKELPEGKDYRELLMASDYPEKDIKFALMYSRYWTVDEDSTSKEELLDEN